MHEKNTFSFLLIHIFNFFRFDKILKMQFKIFSLTKNNLEILLEIYNFVLGIYNILLGIKVKKHIVIIIGLVMLMGLGVFTSMKSRFPFHLSDIIQFVTNFVLFSFAMVSQIRLLISAKRGLPAKDELSKKIWQKASSVAYFIAIYYLLALWLISEQIKIETGVIFQLALLGMLVIWAVCWGVISIIGMKNEQ